LIGREQEMAETMILGLHLVEGGVTWDRFRRRFGLEVAERYARELQDVQALGRAEVEAARVRLSRRGRLLGNQVFVRYLPS
jgi:oxygen-independent coproporphyrinogen III oxidase